MHTAYIITVTHILTHYTNVSLLFVEFVAIKDQLNTITPSPPLLYNH